MHIVRRMKIVADRFLETGSDTIDLATGDSVMLRCLPACEAHDERRWAAACARLVTLWHEDMPSLLDYGGAGAARFEAYERRRDCGPSAAAPEAVCAFLAEAGVSGACEHTAAPRLMGRPRIGMRLLPRRALLLFGELLEEASAGQPRAVDCAAEPGAGATTFLQAVAADGRRRGFAPVSLVVLERYPLLVRLLDGRHALLLSDGRLPARAGEQWLLRLTRACAAGHVLLRLGPARAWSDARLRLSPFGADELMKAASIYPPGSLASRAVSEAAARSGGLPGPFVDALRFGRTAAVALRVAEARAAYAPGAEPADSGSRIEHPWADMLAAADRLSAAGRRAAAERDLRQIAAGAARRDRSHVAAAAELRLGWMLAGRGRLDAAQALFAARGHAVDDPFAIESALGLAGIHVERGALEAAESLLRAARALDPVRASLALARCLYWQGRYAEVERCLTPVGTVVDPLARAAADCLRARVALAEEDLPRAARLAGAALRVAEGHGSSDLGARALEVLMASHGKVAHRDAVRHHASAAIAAARRAGTLVRIPRIRAAALEAIHACGVDPGRRAVDRLLAVAPRVVPLTRARLWLMGARVHPSARDRQQYAERVRSFVTATGARSLIVPGTETPAVTLGAELARLVHLQDTSADPGTLLQALGGWLQDRTGARAVHIVDRDGVRVACAGPSDPITAARRVLVTCAPQPPWDAGDGIEAAVPLRAAKQVIGSLAARWTLARTPERDGFLLVTAAAAFAVPALGALLERRAQAPARADADGIVGRSPGIVRLRETVARAGGSPFPVLIEGESGSGKELVARAIHAASPRRSRACVAINCAALSDDLLEAELFGHARGAFTGAHADRAGLFEQADAGTLFLDEVSELSPRAQAKLLRVLQDGEVRRVGENLTRRADVRVVAASNRNLEDDVRAGRFRRDLLFRLAVIRIAVPALRERPEDIPLIAAHCWQAATERAGSRAALGAAALAALARYDWPGNVRELQNVMAALAVQVPRGRVGAEQVTALVDRAPAGADPSTSGTSLEEARQAFDRRFVAAALARCGGRHAAAARELGVSRQGLAKLMRRLSIQESA